VDNCWIPRQNSSVFLQCRSRLWPLSRQSDHAGECPLSGKVDVTADIAFYMASIQAAASSFAVQTITPPVHAKDEIEGVIAALAGNPGGGLIVMPDIFNTANRELIIAMTARYRVPAIYFSGYFTQSGGLISYGPDYPAQARQAARYIDHILRGAKPSELPVQTPTQFELMINLKTAKVLGLRVPDKLLALADELIE
jgi:putative tryptophan/tyrosine transport system substrate-binding protein